MSEKRVAVVAGATGYVGREVVRLLVEAGISVVAHIRPASTSRQAWTDRFESMGATVLSCPWEPDAFADALQTIKPHLVFALLGTTSKRARTEAIEGNAYDRIDYGLTAMLFEAAETLERAPRFIYLSAAGVSDRSRGAYMKARVRAEAMIRKGALPYVIARPAVITGSDRDESRPGERAAGKILDGGLAVLGAFGARRLRQKYRSTTNTVLGSALVRLALDDSRDYIVAEGEELR